MPIPRTLQMAMSGLQDVGGIRLHAVDRLAVPEPAWRGSTGCGVVAPNIIAAAEPSSCRASPICQEWLGEQVPEVKSVTAHGARPRSNPDEHSTDGNCDTVSVDHHRRERASTDPSANTLIVYSSDHGLAQLYQLRGRIGPLRPRAYAYLTMPAGASRGLFDKRLQVLAA